ncbi:MAG: DUF4142 domain-containing protein [Mucilaginibacter sp.]
MPTFILLLAGVLAGCSQAQKDSAGKADSANMTKDSGQKRRPLTWGQEISGDDAKFAVKAAAGGLAEVELGKLAQQKGSTAAIKNFGAMMVKDHSAANKELIALAKSKQIALPDSLDAPSKKLKADLEAKSGQEFDKAYASAMVEDHEEDISDFVRATKVAKYPEIAAFAQKTLPVLKMHLAEAQKIKSTF